MNQDASVSVSAGADDARFAARALLGDEMPHTSDGDDDDDAPSGDTTDEDEDDVEDEDEDEDEDAGTRPPRRIRDNLKIYGGDTGTSEFGMFAAAAEAAAASVRAPLRANGKRRSDAAAVVAASADAAVAAAAVAAAASAAAAVDGTVPATAAAAATAAANSSNDAEFAHPGARKRKYAGDESGGATLPPSTDGAAAAAPMTAAEAAAAAVHAAVADALASVSATAVPPFYGDGDFEARVALESGIDYSDVLGHDFRRDPEVELTDPTKDFFGLADLAMPYGSKRARASDDGTVVAAAPTSAMNVTDERARIMDELAQSQQLANAEAEEATRRLIEQQDFIATIQRAHDAAHAALVRSEEEHLSCMTDLRMLAEERRVLREKCSAKQATGAALAKQMAELRATVARRATRGARAEDTERTLQQDYANALAEANRVRADTVTFVLDNFT